MKFLNVNLAMNLKSEIEDATPNVKALMNKGLLVSNNKPPIKMILNNQLAKKVGTSLVLCAMNLAKMASCLRE